MSTTTLQIKTPDGTAEARLHKPDGEGPFPGVLFYMDALGFRPAMHQMAERLAKAGYAVLEPNLFYREGEVVTFDPKSAFADPATRERLMKIIMSLDRDSAMRDTAAYLDALAAQPGVRRGPVGCVGYCMGGRLAFTAAGALPERVGAAASFHGGHLVTDKPDSPHLQAGKIKAALYFGIAGSDGGCAELAGPLQEAKLRFHIDFEPEVKHGWTVADHPVYDEAGAERHWRHLTAFFAENLS